MDYRRLQLTGEATYILSLPKKWVQRNGLDKGDVLGVVERGDNLVLRAKEEKEAETDVNIGGKDLELILRLLITKYIQGYDSITVKSKEYISLDVRSGLKSISNLLIGMEEFGETSNEITFKMLMREKGNVEDTVLRMHRMSASSLEELLRNIHPENYNENVLKSIIQRDNEIDKFYFLVLRQLSSLDTYDAIMWVQIARIIERISDHVEKIARLTLEGGRIEEEQIDRYAKLFEMYSSVKTAIANRSLKTANQILQDVKSFRSKEEHATKKTKSVDANALLIGESFRRIGEYLSDIAEVTINMS